MSQVKQAVRRARAIDFSNRLLAALCFHHPEHCPEAVRELERIALLNRKAIEELKIEKTQQQKAAEWVERRKSVRVPVEMPIIDIWREPTVRTIQQTVCECFGLERAELLSRRRSKEIVWPRQIAMYLAKKLTTCSLPEIARRFGGRDHTTVLHAIKKVGFMIERDPQLGEQIKTLRQSLMENINGAHPVRAIEGSQDQIPGSEDQASEAPAY